MESLASNRRNCSELILSATETDNLKPGLPDAEIARMIEI
jgi:hypothetical protein